MAEAQAQNLQLRSRDHENSQQLDPTHQGTTIAVPAHAYPPQISTSSKEVEVPSNPSSQPSPSTVQPVVSSQAEISRRSARIQLLFQDHELPQQPTSALQRTIDEEMSEVYSSQPQATPNMTKATSHPLNREMVKEVVKADVYDSLEDGSDMDDEFIAACARKEAAKLKEAQSKSKKSKDKNNKNPNLDYRSASHDMDPRATAWTGSKRDLRPAEGATKLGTFSPVSSVAKFPYKYIDKEHSERVADKFFNDGKFWGREIDVYYIHPPSDISIKPILLMPVAQVEKLIAEIGRAFHCKLSLPPYAEESGFCISFFDDGTPQPRFLGTSTGRGHFSEMESRVPPPLVLDFGPPRMRKSEVDRSFEAFRQKMILAVESTKRKSKAIKEKKRQNRIQTHLDWFKQLKRTQRYLGMRAHVVKLPVPSMEGEWEEQQEKFEQYLFATNQKLLPLDISKPAPYDFEKGVIFICIDVESNELAHNQITEIGISTLDTLDLVNLPPGEGGKNWIKKIRSRHFRIAEYSHIVNKTYIHGCADKFEFGASEWISIEKAVKAIDSCFKPPYSAGFTLNPSEAKYLDAQYQDMMDTDNPNPDINEPLNNSVVENQSSVVTNSDEIVIDRDEVVSSSGSIPEHITVASSTTTVEHQSEIKEDGVANGAHTEKNAVSSATESLPEPFTPAAQSTANNDAHAEDILSLLAARKSVASRAKEDPTILEDPSLQPDLPDFNRETKTLTKVKVDEFHNDEPTSKSNVTTAAPGTIDPAQPTRPIILLGHDTKSDLSYLRILGYDPASYNPNLLEALDTACMYKILKRESNSPKLGSILLDLGLTGWHLHNAGNDARYTMEAMIGIVLKSRKVEDNNGIDPDEANPAETSPDQAKMEQKIKESTEQARLRVIEEFDTWASIPDLAPYAPATPPKSSKMPGLNPFAAGAPPTAYFTSEHSSSPFTRPGNLTFPTEVYPSSAIDGGEAIPLSPPAKKNSGRSRYSTDMYGKKFAPGTMDKEAVEAELAKQIEFDWDGDGLTIDGRKPVETAFERIVRERKEQKAEMERREMGLVDNNGNGNVDGNETGNGDAEGKLQIGNGNGLGEAGGEGEVVMEYSDDGDGGVLL